MKPKIWLAIGGAVVAIVLVVLWLMSGSKTSGLRDPAKGSGSSAGATTVALSDPSAPRPPSIDVDKVIAEGSDVKILPDGTREYHRGNMIVRDHRSGGSAGDKPFEYGSGAHPNAMGNERHKMDPAVIASLRPGIADALAQCGRDVPADMRGPKPSMRATVTLAVTGGKVTVTNTQIDLVDVVGNAADPTKKCLDTSLRNVTTTAPNEPDMTDYSVTVQMPVP